MRILWKRIILAILILAAAFPAGFVGWAYLPQGPGAVARADLYSDERVSLEVVQGWMVFRPKRVVPDTGLIFYPGGHVDYRSYAPLLRSLAELNYLVVLAPMPLSLAIFAPDSADGVIKAFPQIRHWAIGGHSLGGAMAARYCFTHPGQVQGLILLGAYPAATDALAGQKLAVVSIYGSQDGQAKAIEASRPLLPAGANYVRIEGGNHAQFGDYGLQPGDGEAQISPAEQVQKAIVALAAFFQKIS